MGYIEDQIYRVWDHVSRHIRHMPSRKRFPYHDSVTMSPRQYLLLFHSCGINNDINCCKLIAQIVFSSRRINPNDVSRTSRKVY